MEEMKCIVKDEDVFNYLDEHLLKIFCGKFGLWKICFKKIQFFNRFLYASWMEPTVTFMEEIKTVGMEEDGLDFQGKSFLVATFVRLGLKRVWCEDQ